MTGQGEKGLWDLRCELAGLFTVNYGRRRTVILRVILILPVRLLSRRSICSRKSARHHRPWQRQRPASTICRCSALRNTFEALREWSCVSFSVQLVYGACSWSMRRFIRMVPAPSLPCCHSPPCKLCVNKIFSCLACIYLFELISCSLMYHCLCLPDMTFQLQWNSISSLIHGHRRGLLRYRTVMRLQFY